MDITVTQLLTALSTITAGAFLWYLNKPKQKKEIEAIITDQWYKLTERLGEERAELIHRINRNDSIIRELEKHRDDNVKIIAQLTRDNEELKYQNRVTELEMMQLKKLNDFKIWKRDMVYLLDDDRDVLDEFGHKFNKISVVDFKGFHNNDEFMAATKHNKPAIVVIDYSLGGGKTAEDIIRDLGYEPEIFIMSINASYEQRFHGKKIRFFPKDSHYIYKIAMAIIQHLAEKK